jgi:hypothetical protein
MLDRRVGPNPRERVGCPGLGRLGEPGLSYGSEVEALVAGPREQTQVPDVVVAGALGIDIGKADRSTL